MLKTKYTTIEYKFDGLLSDFWLFYVLWVTLFDFKTFNIIMEKINLDNKIFDYFVSVLFWCPCCPQIILYYYLQMSLGFCRLFCLIDSSTWNGLVFHTSLSLLIGISRFQKFFKTCNFLYPEFWHFPNHIFVRSFL